MAWRLRLRLRLVVVPLAVAATIATAISITIPLGVLLVLLLLDQVFLVVGRRRLAGVPHADPHVVRRLVSAQPVGIRAAARNVPGVGYAKFQVMFARSPGPSRMVSTGIQASPGPGWNETEKPDTSSLSRLVTRAVKAISSPTAGLRSSALRRSSRSRASSSDAGPAGSVSTG